MSVVGNENHGLTPVVAILYPGELGTQLAVLLRRS